MEQRDFHLDVHREHGSYWGEVRELPGCFVSGDTAAELVEAAEEAVALYLAPPADQPAPPVTVRLAALELSVQTEQLPEPA